jgi:hypothetical protein
MGFRILAAGVQRAVPAQKRYGAVRTDIELRKVPRKVSGLDRRQCDASEAAVWAAKRRETGTIHSLLTLLFTGLPINVCREA